jgi:hypothetical protein
MATLNTHTSHTDLVAKYLANGGTVTQVADHTPADKTPNVRVKTRFGKSAYQWTRKLS